MSCGSAMMKVANRAAARTREMTAMHWHSHRHFHLGHHVHLGFHHPRPAGVYVGRVGALGVALGIGTAMATGFCGACIASADAGDSGTSSAGAPRTSTSQSVRAGPRRPSRTAAPTSLSGVGNVPRAASAAEPKAAETRRSAPAAIARASTVLVDLPETPVVPPAALLAAPPPSAATMERAQSGTAVPAPGMAGSAAPTMTVAQAAATATILPGPAAGVFQQKRVNNFAASLSEALSGNTSGVAADAAVALMAGAARRETDSTTRVPRGAAARAATTTGATTTGTTAAEFESMSLTPSNAGRAVLDRNASGGYALALTGSATVSATVILTDSTALTIRAKAGSGAPDMTLSIDGVPITTVVVSSTNWSDYTITGVISSGSHLLAVSSSNATSAGALYLDKLTVSSGPVIEEFLGKSKSAPNSAVWTTKTGSGWDPGIETYKPSNAYLDGKGHLVIKADKTRSGYTSGWVESKNKMSYGYGTITARIKVPQGQGLWPAFWLKGADEDTTAWPRSGEIDVLELPSTTTTLYSTLHGPIAGSTRTQQAQIISNLPDLSADYHDYWVRHLKDEITFGVDDQTLGTLTPDSLDPGETWVYNRPMQVILNLAVGGPWAGAPDGSTKFPALMLVDSVRWDPA